MNVSFISRESVFLAVVIFLMALATVALWSIATAVTTHFKAQNYLAHISLMTERTRGAYIAGVLNLASQNLTHEMNNKGLIPSVFLSTTTGGALTDLWSNPLTIAYAPVFHDGSAGLILSSNLDHNSCSALITSAAPSISEGSYRLWVDDIHLDAPFPSHKIRRLCKKTLTTVAFEVSITPPRSPSSVAAP